MGDESLKKPESPKKKRGYDDTGTFRYNRIQTN